MTIEVNTNYVSDRLIYAGLTRNNANQNKDILNAFNAANTDSDDTISEKEYQEYFNKSCSIEVQTVDKVCTKASAPRQYETTLLENTQVDFYPELEIANIPTGAKDIFKLIDTDKNNKLSCEEITTFNKVRDMLEETKQKIRKKCDKHGKKFGFAGIAGIAGALGGAYFALDGITVAGTFLGCIGPVGWAIAGVSAIGAAGYMICESRNYKKECKEIEQDLLQQTNNHPYVLEHLQDFQYYYD